VTATQLEALFRGEASGQADPGPDSSAPGDVADNSRARPDTPGFDAEDLLEIQQSALAWLVEISGSSPSHRVDAISDEPDDVRRLRSLRQKLKEIDNTFGGRSALAMATAVADREVATVVDRLTETGDGQARTAGLRLAIEFELDCGWMAYDSGDDRQAWQHFGNAVGMAHRIGDRMLAGRALGGLSHQALHLGRVSLGRDLAGAARVGAAPAATPQGRAMLFTLEACAAAASHDEATATRALRTAEEALAAMEVGFVDPHGLEFDGGGLLGHAARTMHDLGHHRSAADYARQSIDACQASHARTRCQRNTILAKSLIELGEIDHGVAVGQQILGESTDLRSRHVEEELQHLAGRLKSVGSAVGRDLIEQVEVRHSLQR
jgi:hypothetical protein